MAQPSTRQELIDYCKRKLGAPVLEINVADEQIDDLVDDAVQFFQERHFDGVYQTFYKYRITQDDINRGKAPGPKENQSMVGIATTTATANIVGTATTFTYYETSNFLQVPPNIIGVNKIFHFDGSNTITHNMFSVKYQLFLNDIYWFSSTELVNYYVTKRYLEDIDWIVNPQRQIRFNKRQNRLYIDMSWDSIVDGNYLIMECYRILDPEDCTKVYNDYFLKLYFTASLKKQWGQNLIKFQGVKLPGGVELNGRQIYDDAVKELEEIRM